MEIDNNHHHHHGRIRDQLNTFSKVFNDRGASCIEELDRQALDINNWLEDAKNEILSSCVVSLQSMPLLTPNGKKKKNGGNNVAPFTLLGTRQPLKPITNESNTSNIYNNACQLFNVSKLQSMASNPVKVKHNQLYNDIEEYNMKYRISQQPQSLQQPPPPVISKSTKLQQTKKTNTNNNSNVISSNNLINKLNTIKNSINSSGDTILPPSTITNNNSGDMELDIKSTKPTNNNNNIKQTTVEREKKLTKQKFNQEEMNVEMVDVTNIVETPQPDLSKLLEDSVVVAPVTGKRKKDDDLQQQQQQREEEKEDTSNQKVEEPKLKRKSLERETKFDNIKVVLPIINKEVDQPTPSVTTKAPVNVAKEIATKKKLANLNNNVGGKDLMGTTPVKPTNHIHAGTSTVSERVAATANATTSKLKKVESNRQDLEKKKQEEEQERMKKKAEEASRRERELQAERDLEAKEKRKKMEEKRKKIEGNLQQQKEEDEKKRKEAEEKEQQRREKEEQDRRRREEEDEAKRRVQERSRAMEAERKREEQKRREKEELEAKQLQQQLAAAAVAKQQSMKTPTKSQQESVQVKSTPTSSTPTSSGLPAYLNNVLGYIQAMATPGHKTPALMSKLLTPTNIPTVKSTTNNEEEEENENSDEEEEEVNSEEEEEEEEDDESSNSSDAGESVYMDVEESTSQHSNNNRSYSSKSSGASSSNINKINHSTTSFDLNKMVEDESPIMSPLSPVTPKPSNNGVNYFSTPYSPPSPLTSPTISPASPSPIPNHNHYKSINSINKSIKSSVGGDAHNTTSGSRNHSKSYGGLSPNELTSPHPNTSNLSSSSPLLTLRNTPSKMLGGLTSPIRVYDRSQSSNNILGDLMGTSKQNNHQYQYNHSHSSNNLHNLLLTQNVQKQQHQLSKSQTNSTRSSSSFIGAPLSSTASSSSSSTTSGCSTPEKQYPLVHEIQNDEDIDEFEDSIMIEHEKIPKWAKEPNLYTKLKNQVTEDPDGIFPGVSVKVRLLDVFPYMSQDQAVVADDFIRAHREQLRQNYIGDDKEIMQEEKSLEWPDEPENVIFYKKAMGYLK